MEGKLPKIMVKNKKRLGRGYGSGKGGHTSSRGQKGQKTRRKINILFEGVKVKKSFVKRLPLRRGRGKFKPSSKHIIVNLKFLNVFPSGAKIDLKELIDGGIVDSRDAQSFGVKILGDGEINRKLTIMLPISKSAAKKIEKAGGKVISEK